MAVVLDEFGGGESDARSGTPTTRPSWMLSAIMIAVLLPEELTFSPFGIRLAIARALIMLALPLGVVALARQIALGRYRFVLADILTMMAGCWLIWASASVDGVAVGLVKGGSLALDFWVGYFVFRSMPQGNEARGLVKILCLGFAIVGFISLADPITGGPAMHKIASAVVGYPMNPSWTAGHNLYRFDLFRASSTLEHPILLGIAMVYGLLLSRAFKGGVRLFCTAGCTIGLLAAMSSAPILAAAMSVALLAYGAIFRWKHRWSILVLSFGGIFFVFVQVHPAPFGWLLSHLLLDPSTGYYRLLIWQYGGEVAWSSPWSGIGQVALANWPRPRWMADTIDSLWLRTAMASGIPGSVLIFSALVSAMWLPIRRKSVGGASVDVSEERIAEAISIILFISIFNGFTVDYWGSCWMLLGLFTGLRVNLYQRAENEAAEAAEAMETAEWEERSETGRAPGNP